MSPRSSTGDAYASADVCHPSGGGGRGKKVDRSSLLFSSFDMIKRTTPSVSLDSKVGIREQPPSPTEFEIYMLVIQISCSVAFSSHLV